MAIKPEVLDALVAEGATAQMIAAAVKADALADEQRQSEKRAKDAARQENWTPRLPERDWLPLCGEVYRRDGYVCQYCGDEEGPFAIDHVHPLSRGGSNELSNLVVACRVCNSSKCNLLLVEWRGAYGRGR